MSSKKQAGKVSETSPPSRFPKSRYTPSFFDLTSISDESSDTGSAVDSSDRENDTSNNSAGKKTHTGLVVGHGAARADRTAVKEPLNKGSDITIRPDFSTKVVATSMADDETIAEQMVVDPVVASQHSRGHISTLTGRKRAIEMSKNDRFRKKMKLGMDTGHSTIDASLLMAGQIKGLPIAQADPVKDKSGLGSAIDSGKHMDAQTQSTPPIEEPHPKATKFTLRQNLMEQNIEKPEGLYQHQKRPAEYENHTNNGSLNTMAPEAPAPKMPTSSIKEISQSTTEATKSLAVGLMMRMGAEVHIVSECAYECAQALGNCASISDKLDKAIKNKDSNALRNCALALRLATSSKPLSDYSAIYENTVFSRVMLPQILDKFPGWKDAKERDYTHRGVVDTDTLVKSLTTVDDISQIVGNLPFQTLRDRLSASQEYMDSEFDADSRMTVDTEKPSIPQ